MSHTSKKTHPGEYRKIPHYGLPYFKQKLPILSCTLWIYHYSFLVKYSWSETSICVWNESIFNYFYTTSCGTFCKVSLLFYTLQKPVSKMSTQLKCISNSTGYSPSSQNIPIFLILQHIFLYIVSNECGEWSDTINL